MVQCLVMTPNLLPANRTRKPEQNTSDGIHRDNEKLKTLEALAQKVTHQENERNKKNVYFFCPN